MRALAAKAKPKLKPLEEMQPEEAWAEMCEECYRQMREFAQRMLDAPKDMFKKSRKG